MQLDSILGGYGYAISSQLSIILGCILMSASNSSYCIKQAFAGAPLEAARGQWPLVFRFNVVAQVHLLVA